MAERCRAGERGRSDFWIMRPTLLEGLDGDKDGEVVHEIVAVGREGACGAGGSVWSGRV